MSLIPDGFGHNAYATEPNAGPHDSGLLSDTTCTLATTGQEQQGQFCDPTYTASQDVNEHDLQTQLQQPAPIEQLYLPEQSEQIAVDNQQAEDRQAAQLNYNAQRCQTTDNFALLNGRQTTGPPFDSYDTELAYQQQFVKFVNEIPEPKQNLVSKETQTYPVFIAEANGKQQFHSAKQDQIPDNPKILIDQETQTDSVFEPAKEVNHKPVPVAEQHPRIVDYNQNLVKQETQSHSIFEPELEVNEVQIPEAEQHRQIPDPIQNFIEQEEAQSYADFEPEIGVNEVPISEAEQQLPSPDQIRKLFEQVAQSYSLSEAEIVAGLKHTQDSRQYQPDPPPTDQKQQQFTSADWKQQEQKENQPETDTAGYGEKVLFYFGDCPNKKRAKKRNRLSWLEHTTISVRKGLSVLNYHCEFLADEPHPEEQYVKDHLEALLYLRDRLANVCKSLIDHPDPRAWSLIKEIYFGIDCFAEVKRKLEQGPDDDRTHQETVLKTQMGLEVLSRIRKIIFGWYNNDTESDPAEAGSGPGPAGDQHQRNSRKRSIAEDEPPLIKYRRVDNSFPRFIPNEVTEDLVSAKLMADREREKENQQQQFAKRLSIFNAPTLTQQRVRNNASNIHIDLSDDDDEPMPSFGPTTSYNRPSAPAPSAGHHTSMSSDSTSSLGMRPQMLYSDAVRLGQNGIPESRMNGHSTNPIRSSGHGQEDSLLNQEDRRSEREQYLALLRNICQDQSTIRALNSKPPPLRLINRAPERSNTWGSILSNNKPPQSRQQQQQQQSPQPPTPSSNSANRDFVNYAKLLDQGQPKRTPPPPPPLMRLDSGKGIGRHTSTISISDSASSSSNSSNGSDEDRPNGTGARGNAGAYRANHTGATPSRKPINIDPNAPLPLSEDLQRRFASCRFLKDTYAADLVQRVDNQRREIEHRRQLAQLQALESREARREYEKDMRAKIFQFRLSYKPLLVIGSVDTAREEERVVEFIPLTEEHMVRFNELINGAPHQVIASKFSLQITRNDLRTLLGSSWLNDEVINFYMNLLTERSELRSSELPSVYAMNTFFVPRLLQNGHGGVKRWTRKVDLFSKDIIPVPVHCNGVHWCMAIIHMRNKTIRYYDSMGKPNQDVLDALESYLRQESLDKRKQPFDTSGFRIESVPNVPQQTNGSDCGVFSCMFAEYITRDAPITFSQENMDYFRKKMVLEIADGKLWN